VLTPFEREMGVGILDIGGGTSDFAVYKDRRIRYSKVLPIAGNHFTNDLAIGFGIPTKYAEDLKRRYGTVLLSKILELEGHFIDVDLGYAGGIKKVELNAVGEILRFRAHEILDIFLDEMVASRLSPMMPSGLVLTGGGCLLGGFRELAQEKLDIPVRIGLPQSFDQNSLGNIPDMLKSPVYSTAYGLLVYTTGQREKYEVSSSDESALGRVFKKMRSWIYDLF
jgi:cell division protein FtsA